mgnify:CR=1 FL=1
MAFESFKGIKFTERTASAGTKKVDFYKKIPAVARLGKKSIEKGGFFDYKGLISRSNVSEGGTPDLVHVEQDETTGETSIFYSPQEFRTQWFDTLQASMSAQAFQQISASFFSQIGNAADHIGSVGEFGPALLVGTFESGSLGAETDIIPPCTASYRFIHPGIVNSTTGEATLNVFNESTNALYSTFKFASATGSLGQKQKDVTGALTSSGNHYSTRSFDKNDFHYIQPEFESQWSIVVTPHKTNGGAFALTSSFSSSADFGIRSGSVILSPFSSTPDYSLVGTATTLQYYKGGNVTTPGDGDGAYYEGEIKGFISGEGEFGPGETNGDFFPNRRFIFFPSGSVVRSGSFKYVPEASGAAHATGSSDIRTIYYISGASGPSGSYIPSSSGGTQNFGSTSHPVSGSHIWGNATLTSPASAGFYCDNVGNAVYGAFIGGDYRTNGSIGAITGVTGSIPESQIADGIRIYTTPRFASKSSHS